jgi:hypothetical protein
LNPEIEKDSCYRFLQVHLIPYLIMGLDIDKVIRASVEFGLSTRPNLKVGHPPGSNR